MTIAAALPYYVLPPEIPTAVVVLLAAVALSAWWALHRWRFRQARPAGRVAGFCLRVLVGFGACLAVAQVMLRVLVLATNQLIWPVALIGAAAVEIVLALYALERRIVSRRTGLTLAGLRVAMVALVVAMLVQPVYSLSLSERLRRYVAVLVDDSASMHIPEKQLTPVEKVRLAEMLSELRRPNRFEEVRRNLEALHSDLAVQAEWLTAVGKTDEKDRRRELEGRRESMRETLVQAALTLRKQEEALASALAGTVKPTEELRNALTDVKARLTVQARERVDEAVALTDRKVASQLAQRHEALLATVHVATTTLAEVLPKVAALGEKLDEAFYASLSPEDRAKVDALTERTRSRLARDVLLHQPTRKGQKQSDPCLLTQLQKDYQVKLFTFASAAEEVDTAGWVEGLSPASRPASAPTTQPDALQRTDLSEALRKVMKDFPATQLAGVVVLTDGRHNGPEAPDVPARRLGAQQVPICPVVLGCSQPPRDAAIATVEAPETVFVQDKMYVTADLKLDGLAGKSVRVTLFDADKNVDFQTVRVPADTFRARVQLGDEPKSVGLHNYRIELEKFDDEVFQANNEYPVTVSVTDDRTKLLLIEGRPRWEFRYLKNLFSSRDRSVALQCVLFEPDRIADAPPPKSAPALATRPPDQFEATDLPADEAEWMKFDAVVLGDVDPQRLGARNLDILRKFVADRGGTLVVVAGPRYMPHAYAETPLEDLLPATFSASSSVLAGDGAAFRIALTAEGRDSVILRQQVDPAENLAVWNSIPEITWRHPGTQAKPSATVLAYAVPAGGASGAEVPPFLKDAPASASEDKVAELRRQYERRNALVLHHNVAWGKVLMLGFDRTWRLRYLVGDTYHHKFWGQVLRWAAAEKLPAGTTLVKLGTDRPRYTPDSRITVKAKIVREDLTPLVSDEVAANIFAGDRLVLRKKLLYVPDSAGMYSADVGALPSGTYRVELDAPVAKGLLERDNKEKVETAFSVDPSTSVEQVELTPDRGLLGRLAGLTGGRLFEAADARRLGEALGEPELVLSQKRQYDLWSSWPLLVVMILLVTAEWLLRKKEGLA